MRKAAFSEIPVLKNISQSTLTIGKHALRVYGYCNDVETPWVHRLNCIHVYKFLAEDAFALADPVPARIPGTGKGFNGLGETVGRPACEKGVGAPGIGNIRVKVVPRELPDEISHDGKAICSSILQGCGKVDFLQEVGGRAFFRDDSPLRRLGVTGVLGLVIVGGGGKMLRMDNGGFEGVVREE